MYNAFLKICFVIPIYMQQSNPSSRSVRENPVLLIFRYNLSLLNRYVKMMNIHTCIIIYCYYYHYYHKYY